MKGLVAFLLVATVGCSSYYRPRAGRRVSVIMQDGSVAYVRDGRVYPMGIAGGGLVDAVSGHPQAEEAARSFNTRMTAGWLMLAASLAGLVYLGYRVGDNDDVDEVDGYILGGALLLEAGALISIITAQPYHYDAINLYNDSVAP